MVQGGPWFHLYFEVCQGLNSALTDGGACTGCMHLRHPVMSRSINIVNTCIQGVLSCTPAPGMAPAVAGLWLSPQTPLPGIPVAGKSGG